MCTGISITVTKEHPHRRTHTKQREKLCFFFLFLTDFQPFLEKYLKLQDTCGIHNLHAVPGMLGGFVGAIVAATASESIYSKEG